MCKQKCTFSCGGHATRIQFINSQLKYRIFSGYVITATICPDYFAYREMAASLKNERQKGRTCVVQNHENFVEGELIKRRTCVGHESPTGIEHMTSRTHGGR